MIKLKSIFPGHPIYVQMDFDAEITSGHAYRIDKFEENPDVHGGYEVTLSNPHDNSKEEKCSLNNIRSRAPLFSVFSSNIQNTGLLNMILEEIRNNPKSKIIDYLSTLHKGIPDIVEIFNNAGLEERKRMLTFIRSTFGDKNSFMEIMDFQLPLIKAKIDEKQIKRGISEPESSEDTDKKNIDNLFILLSAQRDREQEKPNSDNPSSNDSKLKNDHKESNTSQNKPRN